MLDTMELRVPGAAAARMPANVCDACALAMRGAYVLFQSAKNATHQLMAALERHERATARSGDGAASVRPSGRKSYFDDAGGAVAADDGQQSPSVPPSFPAVDLVPITTASMPAGSSSSMDVDVNDDTVCLVRRVDVLESAAGRQPAANKKQDFAAHRLQGDNRGFQMLQRSGWQPGESCGRNADGIAEPIE